MIGRNRVVITGLGVLAANGIGKEAFWNSLLAGESGIGPITLFDTTGFKCTIAGEVKNLNTNNLVLGGQVKAKRLSRTTTLGYLAAEEAIEDSGLSEDDFGSAAPILVSFGVGLGGFDHIENQIRRIATHGPDRLMPHAVEACTHASTASLIAALLHVPTQVTTISNNCSSGSDAVVAAYDAIRSGKFDVVICGATDAPIVPSVVAGFSAAGMVGHGDPPEQASRPFDYLRTGGILAEGSGALVLENLDHALARGKVPYMEILGSGQSRDMLGRPICEGLKKSMGQAIENSSLSPRSIDYISAHGPSDIDSDRVESDSIKEVFGKHAYSIPVSSIKASTGNPVSAGGLLQIISSCLSNRNRQILPTGNYTHPDPFCDLDYVPNTARAIKPSYIMINSHGSGASNCSIVIAGVDR